MLISLYIVMNDLLIRVGTLCSLCSTVHTIGVVEKGRYNKKHETNIRALTIYTDAFLHSVTFSSHARRNKAILSVRRQHKICTGSYWGIYEPSSHWFPKCRPNWKEATISCSKECICPKWLILCLMFQWAPSCCTVTSLRANVKEISTITKITFFATI